MVPTAISTIVLFLSVLVDFTFPVRDALIIVGINFHQLGVVLITGHISLLAGNSSNRPRAFNLYHVNLMVWAILPFVLPILHISFLYGLLVCCTPVEELMTNVNSLGTDHDTTAASHLPSIPSLAENYGAEICEARSPFG